MPLGSELRQFLTFFEQTCVEEDREIYQVYSSDDEEPIDHVSEQSQDSDLESECSLNEEEIESLQPNNQIEVTYTGKDGVTKWSSQYHRTNVPRRLEDGIIDKPGVKLVAKNARTEIDCWKLFINDGMMEQILYHTNDEIKKRSKLTKIANKEHTRVYLVKETTMDELLALFGLMYIAGLYRTSCQNLSDLWRSDGTGVEIFRTTMTLQRFCFLQNSLRFDDEATRKDRKAVDNLAPIRSIFEEFIFNCQTNYSPSEYLTIDELLVPFRGKCPIRTHFPNKPANYGIKIYALVDAKDFYTVNLEIYAAKQPDGSYSQSYKPFDIVERLVQPISKSNRNVTFNKKFTSIPLVTHLLNNHKLTSIGTLNRKEKEIPSSFIKNLIHEADTSKFAFQKDLTLVSYKSKQSKVVLVLSSFHHDQGIERIGNKQKPEILTFYDSTKSGVDVVHELCATYNVSRNSKHWTTTVFYTIMNIAAINSLIIYRENNDINMNRRDYIRKLGLALIQSHLFIRKNSDTLPRDLRKRIHEQIGETIAFPANSSKTYKRCKVCPSVKDRKTKHACHVCNKPICMEHVVAICQSCVDSE